MDNGRLQFALEVAVVTLFVMGVFYLVALIIRLIFKKRIDDWKHYYTVAAVAGFMVHRLIITFASPDLQANVADVRPGENASISQRQISLDAPFIVLAESETERFPPQPHLSTQSSNAIAAPHVTSSYAQASGLDAPFIAPDESHVEAFPVQLQVAIEELPEHERSQLNSAMSFLTFGTLANLSADQIAKLESGDERDTTALVLLKMYRFAKSEGDAMTLRKFMHLSQEMKRQKPEWWTRLQEVEGQARLNRPHQEKMPGIE